MLRWYIGIIVLKDSEECKKPYRTTTMNLYSLRTGRIWRETFSFLLFGMPFTFFLIGKLKQFSRTHLFVDHCPKREGKSRVILGKSLDFLDWGTHIHCLELLQLNFKDTGNLGQMIARVRGRSPV